MSTLAIEHLTYRFGEKVLYEEAPLQVDKGDHLGLTGQNGIGKSALIKILTGEVLPDEGTTQWQKNHKIRYLDQHVSVEQLLTIVDFLKQTFQELLDKEAKLTKLYGEYSQTALEKFLEQTSKLQTDLDKSSFYQIDATVQDLVNGLGLQAIGLGKKLGGLSDGQHSKVILARLLLEAPGVLLLGEPTNYLDDIHIQWLVHYLNGFEGNFLLVSHDYQFLNEVTNCITGIKFGKLTKYTGNIEKSFAQKGQNKQTYLKQYQAQQEEIEKMEAYTRKYKAENRITTAESQQKQLGRLERLTPPSSLTKPTIEFPYRGLVATQALMTQKLVVSYREPLLEPLDLMVHIDEKVALKGFNGIGKSTLIKTLTRVIPSLDGEFHYSLNTKIAYFIQDLAWSNEQLAPLDYLLDRFPDTVVKERGSHLTRAGLPNKLAVQSLALLDGGKQAKVKLAELMIQISNLLFLDEPANHVDEVAKESLQGTIHVYPEAVLLVSHEADFYEGITDRVINIEELVK